jgi:hypothetical protein
MDSVSYVYTYEMESMFFNHVVVKEMRYVSETKKFIYLNKVHPVVRRTIGTEECTAYAFTIYSSTSDCR